MLFLNFVVVAAVISCLAMSIIIANARAAELDAPNSNFLKWFNDNGGKASGVSIDYFEGMGRGIVAAKDVEAGDEILYVPKQVILSLEFLKNSRDDIHNRIARAFADDDQTAVIAALLWEKQLGTNSFYHPYIEVLPKNIHNLLEFSEAELRELQHPEVESSAIFAQKGLQETLAGFKKAVESFWPTVDNDVTLQGLHWATSVVDSRGLRFRGKVHLTPFADMFNYSPHPDPRVAADGNFFLNHHVLSDEGIRISSDRKQLSGKQVFEDYGDNTDTNYVMFHGFVADENPFSCVKIQSPPFMDISSEKVLDLLKALQFKSAPGQCVDKNNKFSKALIVYLSTLSFSSTERRRCTKLTNVTNPNFGTIYDKCGYKDVTDFVYKYMDDIKEFGIEGAKDLAEDVMNDFEGLENRFMTFVNKWIDNIFPKYPTTVEDDEKELFALAGKHKPRQEHKALALRFRIKQKKLWRNLCDAFGSACKIDPASAAEASKKASADTASSEAAKKPAIKKPTDEFSTGIGRSLEEDIASFNKWFNDACDKEGAIHKIAASTLPRYRIGTIATADIKEDDVYLQVPTSVIMDVDKARNDAEFGPLLAELNDKVLRGRDSFTELLLFLLDQRFVKKEKSTFWPYLSVLPKPTDLDVPSLWTTEEVSERLKPSFIELQVLNYREKMVKAYQNLVKMEGISKFFPDGLLTFEKFRWAYIVLDSRSIWWNSERHLVPMLDFINCIEGPQNPERVHATALDETERFAVTKAGWDFKSGEQLFENYGQPNLIYFQYHGFSLTAEDGGNTHDCVHMDFNITRDEGMRVNWDKASDVIKRLRLRQQAIIQTCLSTAKKIPESVWLFLALKMNNFEALKESNELGLPTKSGIEFLVHLIDDRLRGYENYSSRHASSRKFIRSEEALFNSLKKSLLDMDESKSNTMFGDEL